MKGWQWRLGTRLLVNYKTNKIQQDSVCISIFYNLFALFQPKSAVEDCSKALELDSTNVKALYRRGLAKKVYY